MLSALLCSVLFSGVTIRQAQVDITPPEALPLGGYTERGSKVSVEGDRLYARSLIFSDSATSIALVSVEMLTIPESLYREVRALVPTDMHLVLTATHTHSAPDSQMLNERMTLNVPGIANYRPRWLKWYAERIARSVNTALAQTPQPVKIWEILQNAVPANRGRRLHARPDQSAVALQAIKPGGDRKPLFLHYAAHAIIYGAENLKLDGDWPGRLAPSFGMVLQGPIGDVSPDVDGPSPEYRMEAFVRMINHFVLGQAESTTLKPQPLSFFSSSIDLQEVRAHPDFARLNKIPDVLAQGMVKRFAPTEAKITAFRLGKLAVVGIPGEPTSHLGRTIRDYGRRIGFKYVLVCSHVNGWMGYILDPEDYDRGGYEATLSFYGREQGLKVVGAAKKALTELATPSKTGTTLSASAPAR